MKYLFLLISAVLFVSCSSAHKHDGHKEGDGCAANCAHHGKDMSTHDCKECADAGKTGGCTACGDKSAERACCSDNSCSKDEAATCAMAPATWALAGNPQIRKEITQDEFNTFYSKNKEKLGKQCQTPAMKYCGKTEKDMNVSEEHVTCLWTKVFRVTRETMPQLDNTPCAKTIKNFAKK